MRGCASVFMRKSDRASPAEFIAGYSVLFIKTAAFDHMSASRCWDSHSAPRQCAGACAMHSSA